MFSSNMHVTIAMGINTVLGKSIITITTLRTYIGRLLL
jgi:hypothetical protein